MFIFDTGTLQWESIELNFWQSENIAKFSFWWNANECQKFKFSDENELMSIVIKIRNNYLLEIVSTGMPGILEFLIVDKFRGF